MKKFLISIYMIFALFALLLYSSASFQNPIHLVALGDSITYGTGDPLKMGYVGRFEQKFNQESREAIQISNFGIPKYTTDDTLAQMNEKNIRAALRRADYVIVFIGTNDFRKSAQYNFAQLSKVSINVGKTHFIDNLDRIFTEIRTENKQATLLVFGLYHPYTQYKNSNEIQSIITEWNEGIKETALHYQPYAFISTMDLFLNQPKASCYSDSIHLNALGYELIAERLYRNMEVLLQNKEP